VPRHHQSERTRMRASTSPMRRACTHSCRRVTPVGRGRSSGTAAREAASGSALRKQGGEANRGRSRDQERTPESSGNVPDCLGRPLAGRERKVDGKQSQPNAAQRGWTTSVLLFESSAPGWMMKTAGCRRVSKRGVLQGD
jgi:hypothetical protein